NCIEACPGPSHLPCQLFMHLLHQFFSEVTSGDSCLIGDNDCLEARIVQNTNSSSSPRIDLISRKMIDIADLFADRAISVDENSDVLRHGGTEGRENRGLG